MFHRAVTMAELDAPEAPEAQIYLAKMYYYGTGVAQDLVQAAKWFEKAAAAGDTDAQFFLALSYEKGTGVAARCREAANGTAGLLSGGTTMPCTI